MRRVSTEIYHFWQQKWRNLSIAKKVLLIVSGLGGAVILSMFISAMLFFSLSQTYSQVMIRGKGWEAISVDLLILFTLSLFFILANIFALRKHRKI